MMSMATANHEAVLEKETGYFNAGEKTTINAATTFASHNLREKTVSMPAAGYETFAKAGSVCQLCL